MLFFTLWLWLILASSRSRGRHQNRLQFYRGCCSLLFSPNWSGILAQLLFIGCAIKHDTSIAHQQRRKWARLASGTRTTVILMERSLFTVGRIKSDYRIPIFSQISPFNVERLKDGKGGLDVQDCVLWLKIMEGGGLGGWLTFTREWHTSLLWGVGTSLLLLLLRECVWARWKFKAFNSIVCPFSIEITHGQEAVPTPCACAMLWLNNPLVADTCTPPDVTHCAKSPVSAVNKDTILLNSKQADVVINSFEWRRTHRTCSWEGVRKCAWF